MARPAKSSLETAGDIKISDATPRLWILFMIGVAALLIIGAYPFYTMEHLKLNDFGDYFGGTANPVLTFLTFIGLLLTIQIQQQELKDSRIQFERSADALRDQHEVMLKQSFEATFFQMLSIHNDIVNSIDLSGVRERHGRDCFDVFYSRLKTAYEREVEATPDASELEIVRVAYGHFWDQNQQNLGHYFRYLYNFIKFVRESRKARGPYVKLVRSQLSDKELVLLYYNCLSTYGAKFKPLAEQFELFDNMPAMLFAPGHERLMAKKAFGENVNFPQVTRG